MFGMTPNGSRLIDGGLIRLRCSASFAHGFVARVCSLRSARCCRVAFPILPAL